MLVVLVVYLGLHVVHVGGTRCVPWGSDQSIHIPAWLTFGVLPCFEEFFIFSSCSLYV